MLWSYVQGVRDELTAESMRAATLVGLAPIPLGFLGIYFFGAGNVSFILLVLAGAAVGLIYSGRSTPAHRAGALAGLFVPIPLLTVQFYMGSSDLWSLSGSVASKIAVAALAILVALAAWTILASVVIIVAFVTAVIVDAVRPYLPGIT